MPFCLGGSTPSDHHDAQPHHRTSPAHSDRNSNGLHKYSSSDTGYLTRRSARPVARKLVVVGDGACGKTSLLNVFAYGRFPEDYEPTVFETHVKQVTVHEVPVELALWDTAGQEDFAKLRSLSYADTHVVLLCFSVDNRTSLENVESLWVDEIMTACPGVKLCLVALKCDLREDEDRRRSRNPPVMYEEGLNVAKRIKASRYMECSAKHNRGVKEAFQEAAAVSITAPRMGETRGSKRPDDTPWWRDCVIA